LNAVPLVVVDYGVNNLRSVRRALEEGGHAALLSSDPDLVRRADRVVMPGVGHYAKAMQNLRDTGLGAAVQDVAAAGRPVMGICLGMQLFFAKSDEAPEVQGLGLLPGRITRFAVNLPVPHVGWAAVQRTEAGLAHPVAAKGFAHDPEFFYHVHSFHPTDLPDGVTLGTGDYGGAFATLVGRDNVLGAQFHPEKSQQAGIRLLAAFAEWTP
jgi:glutamine amidotransferase